MDFQTGQTENLCKKKGRKRWIYKPVQGHMLLTSLTYRLIQTVLGLSSPRPYISHFYILVQQNKRLVFIFKSITVSGAYLTLGDKNNLTCHVERSLFPYLFKLLLRPLTFAEGCYYTTNNNISICKSFYVVFQAWIL